MAKAQRVLSIEIGYSLTQVCEMDFNTKKPKVYGVFSMKTPEGVLNDGYIKVTDEFIRDLKSYIAANAMNAKNVIFVVSSTKIANREATIPAVKLNKVRDLLMSNITDYFPVDPTMYQFSHNIMDTVVDENKNKQYRVMIMAAPSDIMTGYYDLARALGLDLLSIDYSGNAIYQALRGRVSTGVNLTVKIDERSSLLTVTNNGIITMQRSGIYGADQVVDIMMETDIYGEPLSYEAAVKTLRRNNMVMKADEMESLEQKEAEAAELERAHREAVTMAEITGDNAAVASAAMAARQADANIKMLRLRRDVTSAYEQLINSIVRVIDYYNSKNRDAAIDNIIITGIAADFWGFAELLSADLGRNVEVLRNLVGTSVEQGMHLQDVSLGDYITVIGAGLSEVGFMPANAGKETKKGSGLSTSSIDTGKVAIVVGAVAAVVTIGILAYYVPAYFMAQTQNKNLLEKKAQLEPVQDTYNEYMSVKGDYDYVLAIKGATDNYNSKMYEMFKFLEKILPKSTEIQNMDVTTDTMSITVRVDNKREAAATIMALREYEDFADVSVTFVDMATDDQASMESGYRKDYVEFTATCTYGFNPILEEAEAEGDNVATEDSAEATETEESVSE